MSCGMKIGLVTAQQKGMLIRLAYLQQLLGFCIAENPGVSGPARRAGQRDVVGRHWGEILTRI